MECSVLMMTVEVLYFRGCSQILALQGDTHQPPQCLCQRIPRWMRIVVRAGTDSVLLAAKGRAVTKVVKNLIQIAVPIFIELKRLLESKNSLLIECLMECLRALLKDYKNDMERSWWRTSSSSVSSPLQHAGRQGEWQGWSQQHGAGSFPAA